MGEGFGQWFFFMYLCIQEKRAVSLSIVRQNGSHKSVKKLLHFCYTTTWTNQLGSCYTTKYERVVHFPLSPQQPLIIKGLRFKWTISRTLLAESSIFRILTTSTTRLANVQKKARNSKVGAFFGTSWTRFGRIRKPFSRSHEKGKPRRSIHERRGVFVYVLRLSA